MLGTTPSLPLRLFAALTALLTMLAAMTIVAPAAHAEATDTHLNIVYTADTANPGAGATVTDYTGPDGVGVTIPDSAVIQGVEYAVMKIGADAFKDGGLSGVVFDAGITSIADSAFENNSLVALDLPETLTSIGEGAFRSALAGGSLVIPNSVTSIGAAAFSDNALTAAALPTGLTSIPEEVLRENLLTSITIPAGVTSIGDVAFAGNQLSSVSIPKKVEQIGEAAFASNGLDVLSFQADGTAYSIGFAAFAENSIQTLTLPETMQEIGAAAFAENDLTSVSFPYGLNTIQNSAFEHNNLTSIRIPGTVDSIGHDAFDENPALHTVRMEGLPAAGITDASAVDQTFDTASGSLVVLYVAGQQDTYYPGVGYTFPTWKGYSTKPVIQTLKPTILGTFREKSTLTADEGPLDLAAAVAYQWKADGKPIGGATGKTLKLAKAQAGRKVSVTLTATFPNADPVIKSSTSKMVSSPYKRIVLSSKNIKKGSTFKVAATGLKAYQKVKIILNGKTVYSGKADSTGTIFRAVKFKAGTKYGKRLVKVYGLKSKGKPKYVAKAYVRYYK